MFHRSSSVKRRSKPKENAERRGSIIRVEKGLQSTLAKTEGSLDLKQLPLLKDAKLSDQESLFIKKLQQCCVRFDFVDSQSNLKSKDIKTKALTELAEHISGKFALTERIYCEIAIFVAENIFRVFKFSKMDIEAVLEGDSIFEEASWCQLKLVYQVFLNFLNRSDFSLSLADCFDEAFLSNFLDTFNSGDPRERKYLKRVLHRLYAKLVTRRTCIRKLMSNIYLGYIYENQQMNGICELLDTSGSIASGYALPLKPEHIAFLNRVLIPLHKTNLLGLYHAQLKYCMTQFVEKEPSLIVPVVLEVLNLWPSTNSAKQILFLNELEDLLEGIDTVDFGKIQKPLFERLAHCISNENSLVSQRALLFWANDDLQNLIESHEEIIMPIVYPVFLRISKNHWNPTIMQLVKQILKRFRMTSHQEAHSKLKKMSESK